jgi:hypothetical protein
VRAIGGESYRIGRAGGCQPAERGRASLGSSSASPWKTNCRQRVKGCDGVIALLSENVKNADGARWEIKCAIADGVPIIAVHIFTDDSYVPPELNGAKAIAWTWDGIGN